MVILYFMKKSKKTSATAEIETVEPSLPKGWHIKVTATEAVGDKNAHTQTGNVDDENRIVNLSEIQVFNANN